MKNPLSLFLLLTIFWIQILPGQSFQEICPTSTTNGTVVNFQYYNDTLYSTGFFNLICGEPVGYVGKWQDDEWIPSSINISDPGHALKVINDQLYIAKYEEQIDSNWVYIYNNSVLEKVGNGVYLTTAAGFSQLPNIYDIVEYDGKIIACGEFDRVGQESISGIMQWDGNSWESLGSGLSGNITNTAPVMFPHQMLVHNSELYVVGNFKFADGIEVNGIAKWNGSEWMNVGAGFDNTVYAITVFENEIIIGGSFTESAGLPLSRIAKWNGTAWEAMEFGFTQSSANDFIFVHTLKVIEDILYVAGGLKEITFSDNTSQVCNGIISYFDSTVNTFNGGVAGNDIEAVEKVGDEILIGGGVFGSGYLGTTQMETSLLETVDTDNIKIYPNPFDDLINIKTTTPFERYEVLTIKGQSIESGNFDQTIDLNLSAGIYILKLVDQEGFYTIRKILRM